MSNHRDTTDIASCHTGVWETNGMVKVMFSVMSICQSFCPRVGEVPYGASTHPLCKGPNSLPKTCSNLFIMKAILSSGRFASYWKAFLFLTVLTSSPATEASGTYPCFFASSSRTSTMLFVKPVVLPIFICG